MRIAPPAPYRLESVAGTGVSSHSVRLVRSADLFACFKRSVLARSAGRGRKGGPGIEYMLFVPDKPSADEAIAWSSWATGVWLDHGGKLGTLRFGWGRWSADGWEGVG